MSSQISTNAQILESNLLESDLNSDLISNDGFISTSNSADETEVLELELQSVDSTTNLMFDDLEIATDSLYSNSVAFNHTGDESSENPDSEISEEEMVVPMGTADPSLTKMVVVGEEGGTQFTFNFAEDTPQEVIDGVTQAAENWSSVLQDDVNINIDFTFEPDETGQTLGSAVPTFIALPYLDDSVPFDVNSALAEDVTSTNDSIAVDNLPEDNNISFLINNTAENNGIDTPYLDDNGGLNNSTILMTRANARALGLDFTDLAEELGTTPESIAEFINATYGLLVDPNGVDASMNVSSNISWDFDPSDGIAADSFDFVGTATHEIGHALGFTSGAEFLDQFAVAETEGANIDQFTSENAYAPSALDLFRFSPESFEQGARDFTTGNIDDKYFSLDGGQTAILPLSEGENTSTGIGDRQQLSHWEDNLNIGIMDPTGSPGESQGITDNDLIAFDVIGWDVA